MQRNVLIISVAGMFTLALAAFLARGGWDGRGATYSAGALLGGAAGFALYHSHYQHLPTSLRRLVVKNYWGDWQLPARGR